jgi:sec-independent protein translocase protein TatB
MAGEFQSQFNEAMREADLDDVKKHVDDLRSLNPKSIIANQLSSVTDELTKVDGAMRDQLSPFDVGTHVSPFDVGASHEVGAGFSSASAAVAGLEADHRSTASVIDAALAGEHVAVAPLDIAPAPTALATTPAPTAVAATEPTEPSTHEKEQRA